MKQALKTAPLFSVALAAGLHTAPGLAEEPAAQALGTVIVTGNRGSEKRTVTSSPVPIDVISARQLQETGKPGLMEALSASVPSLTLPEKTGWDASGMARAPNLRGLNAAQVLVLVNGKRRHTSATLNISGINAGAAPSDLDLIPIGAIDHVEVLRDGAAAQYGSDAIAGVINVILKADTSGTAVSTVGQGYDGKKQTVQQNLQRLRDRPRGYRPAGPRRPQPERRQQGQRQRLQPGRSPGSRRQGHLRRLWHAKDQPADTGLQRRTAAAGRPYPLFVQHLVLPQGRARPELPPADHRQHRHHRPERAPFRLHADLVHRRIRLPGGVRRQGAGRRVGLGPVQHLRAKRG